VLRRAGYRVLAKAACRAWQLPLQSTLTALPRGVPNDPWRSPAPRVLPHSPPRADFDNSVPAFSFLPFLVTSMTHRALVSPSGGPALPILEPQLIDGVSFLPPSDRSGSADPCSPVSWRSPLSALSLLHRRQSLWHRRLRDTAVLPPLPLEPTCEPFPSAFRRAIARPIRRLPCPACPSYHRADQRHRLPEVPDERWRLQPAFGAARNSRNDLVLHPSRCPVCRAQGLTHT
jgi:hypothetical protein